MRKKTKKSTGQESGWRKLAPKSSRRPSTIPAFRKKLNLLGRIFILVFVLGIAGVGFWSLDRWFGPESGPLDLTGPGAPISKIEFSSDGALSPSWFDNWFGPLRERTLMDIDIEKLRIELEGEDQIESAMVSRRFPSTLHVQIRERTPLLVLRLRNRSGSHEDWIVGSQGKLYRGAGYSRAELSLLPSLSVPSKSLKRLEGGGGFHDLGEIALISPLLELVKRDYPAMYRDWQVVSYDLGDREGPYSYVMIRSGKVREIRFSPRDYAAQLKRLHYILLEPDFRRKPVIESINLCHDRSVFAKI